MNYDETQHLHIRYNKKGLDLEAIGLKQLDVDVWDIYFNFEDHAIDKPTLKFSMIDPFGCRIFSISSSDLSIEHASKYFELWIELELNI
ncbi:MULTISPECIES: DUF3986 family protein [Bacillus]|uniref:DUF3986 family protein n=1 Tax=Bacillus glycinifermentans TaxID=1664069 RepID=A0AAJ3Z275_9BACI|nr:MULTISPECIES: DUF3986 family protein [Bacillus]KKB73030.1 hypothetical protein TH62_14425 [Bacillus sp. TH008]MDU0070778.1 DUF3986 family protein [Bacillus sp. IG6]MED8018649.1 DUF3986 family protein [Bacillus glycinifermentans]QAT66200.1 DUF3986 family protein [Bacillus glycinifermentans]WKB75908.1 DUF3986 family protein [Bacillus glycinifermentans]